LQGIAIVFTLLNNKIIMNEQLLDYVQFNLWANKHFTSMLDKLDAEQWHTTIAGSFESIHKTVSHIYFAESIWNQRMAMTDPVIVPTDSDFTNAKDLCAAWLAQSEKLVQFVKQQKRSDWYTHELSYRDIKKIQHKSALQHIIWHVCNHGTFHRGQLVNFMRAVGVASIMQTDFITYKRQQKK
jgi:uncharacterized damage-inducible protein DinB